MVTERLPANDPRTVARDIPGVFDALFPQLAPGVVAHFNRTVQRTASCVAIPPDLVNTSTLQRAMLFELAVAACEQLITGSSVIDWDASLAVAVARQRRHFDAMIPAALTTADKTVACRVAENLAAMLHELRKEAQGAMLISSPTVPGYRWIASGVGDFALGLRLIEVKCTSKHFSSSDYRQIVMYWLLSYAFSLEHDTPEWSHGILINPRLNYIVSLPFNEIIAVIAAGRSKIELLELFSAIVGDAALEPFSSAR